MPLGGERQAGAVGDGTRRVEREGPERQVDHEAEEVAGHRAVDGQHRDLGLAAQRRKQPGEHAHPGAAEHLVRHPGADAPGDQGGGEQRRAAEREAEARAEDPPGQDQDEEHGLDSCRARAQRAQRGVDGGQHAQHGQGLGVDAAVRDLREHHQQDQGEQRAEHQRRRLGRGERARRDRERPPERDQPEERRHRDGHGQPRPHPDRGADGRPRRDRRAGGHRVLAHRAATCPRAAAICGTVR